MEKFDIVVVGAGPAGSTAALNAARKGRSVCLLERKAKAGTPVRCGEGIGHHGLFDNVDVNKAWIKNVITRSIMVAPNGLKVEIGNVGESYIIDREKMDYDLVQDAIKAGATYYAEFSAVSLKRVSDSEYDICSKDKTIKAKCVILADGVESRLARFVGWDTTLAMDDIETCAIARVTSPLVDEKSCVFYIGSKVAPGGYAWIFPRGKGVANVGLGLSGTNSRAGSSLEFLNRFIAKEFPDAQVTHVHSGGVPVTKWVRPLVRDGVMLVGDAAHQVNCLNGAGIAYSLYAGRLCGETAASAFVNDTVNYDTLKKYNQVWKKRFGKQQDRSFSLKEFVAKHADDNFLNRIAESLYKEDPQKMNYLRVFLRTFAKHPILLFRAFQLFK